jgi:hypothetical protein
MSEVETSRNERIQQNINAAYSQWSADHQARYSHVGTLPYRPKLFPDQQLEKASRSINRAALWLPETAYLKGMEKIFASAVGSRALAETIIAGFEYTPATPLGSASLVDHSLECLENGQSFGITTGHIDRLTDVAELTQGLSLAVSRRVGRKHIGSFKVLVNKNMTRETFFRVPAAWLGTLGLGIYWGSPLGESAEKNNLSEEAIAEINKRFSQAFMKDKKKGAVALGFVPSLSGMKKTEDPLEFEMRDAAYSASVIGHCEGGVIPANRYGDEVIFGSVIETKRGDDETLSKKDFNRQLADKVALELVEQTKELTGAPVTYRKLEDAA